MSYLLNTYRGRYLCIEYNGAGLGLEQGSRTAEMIEEMKAKVDSR